MPLARRGAVLCIVAWLAGGAAEVPKEVAHTAEGSCAAELDVSTTPSEVSGSGALQFDQALFQRESRPSRFVPSPRQGLDLASTAASTCTRENNDPWRTGSYIKCCPGTQKELRRWSGSAKSYLCRETTAVAPTPATQPNSGSCTGKNVDPWRTGSYVKCCPGTQKELGRWSGSVKSYRCRESGVAPSPGPSPAPSPGPSPAPAGGAAQTKMLEWNVYYSNKDVAGMAQVINANSPLPDILGLCELTTSMEGMAASLSRATGVPFRVQPGRGGWKGYGTDIFYNSDKWKALDGGVASVHCSGSRGGKRAANWAALRDRATGKVLITGGIHLSYCRGGCNSVHECELGGLYDKLEAMKRKYPGAPVAWMGDLNLHVGSSIVRGLRSGRIGGRRTFSVDDVSRTNRNTHMNGGRAIDHIFFEKGAFDLRSGQHGSTGQGQTGRRLSGADHFPIYSTLSF